MAKTSQAITDLKAIPFDSMIGGPLSACIDAQKEAAMSTVSFIRSVGLTEENKVINVTFLYKRDGKNVELTVPLLTIVPIPYIAIDSININFKAAVSGTSKEEQSKEKHSEFGWEMVEYYKKVDVKTTYSNKKDSKATQESTYSIESTIDINVSARSESIPAGMAKVLEMLNQAIMLEPVNEKNTPK